MITLNAYSLDFSKNGTLASLSYGKGPSLLHDTDYRFPLENGRSFTPRGWDECFPTIEPSGGFGTMGALVGNLPSLVAGNGSVVQEWKTPGIAVKRTFCSPAKNRLLVKFEARNTGARPLPFLWASHALFSTAVLRRVTLPGNRVLADFSRNDTCGKFFLPATGPAVLEREETVITLESDQPYWGVWLNRGGWPKDSPAGFCCIGIEATNQAAEVPGNGTLPVGDVFQGKVELKIDIL